jgi:hypothetical protein
MGDTPDTAQQLAEIRERQARARHIGFRTPDVDFLLGHIDTLWQSVVDREIVLHQNRAYYARIGQLERELANRDAEFQRLMAELDDLRNEMDAS